ncbi:hypothetical protein ACFE04_008324 [Oxalis oulophora]
MAIVAIYWRLASGPLLLVLIVKTRKKNVASRRVASRRRINCTRGTRLLSKVRRVDVDPVVVIGTERAERGIRYRSTRMRREGGREGGRKRGRAGGEIENDVLAGPNTNFLKNRIRMYSYFECGRNESIEAIRVRAGWLAGWLAGWPAGRPRVSLRNTSTSTRPLRQYGAAVASAWA